MLRRVSVTHLIDTYGLALIFLLVLLESAGIPLPGETALITGAVLASQGHGQILWVIVVASAAAIIGDNGGYWVGRRWGRQLLTRWKLVERYAERVLPPAERFFEKHGPKTVFIGRFLPVLRFTAAWMAGIARMRWWKFLLWNATGGIVWATAVSLVSFYFGKAVIDAYDRYGLLGAGVLAGAAILVFLVVHFVKKRLAPET
jgi:membrane protein DedA with SNARE-associated domain